MESVTNFFKFYSIAVVVLKVSLVPELSCAVGNEKEYIMKERDYKNYFPTEKSELSESHLNIRHKPFECTDIDDLKLNSTICRNILTNHRSGDGSTRFRLNDRMRVMSPNIFGQEHVLSAEREIHLYNLMHTFGFFVEVPDCFKKISFITCLSYFPVCAEDASNGGHWRILPCRKTCKQVLRKCPEAGKFSSQLPNKGSSIPFYPRKDLLECSKLPIHQPCIAPTVMDMILNEGYDD
ncbi:uncharacterized protein LOC134854586 [Symsagittifera roscoffensis]|uniref:uncharacterized protein LOC134854586 n=1 Tax=Symsagittifera roscoffensis TaxID=84072 RepID=UPI00307B2AEA